MQTFPQLSADAQRRELNQLFAQVYDIDTARTVATKMLYQLLPSHASDVGTGAAPIIAAIYSCSSVFEVQSLLLEHLSRLSRQDNGECGGNDYIQKILTYVNENLSDPNLSLKGIAQNVLFMNVNYVSKQFLRKTGEKFSSYVSSLRMERAKTILQNTPHAKITDVAEAVGLGGNPQYFSQVFKKHTGYTPSQFAGKES